VVDGWELDGTWSPLQGLDMLFGIGSLESRTQTGLRARGVPEGVNYRFFGRYTFASGPVKGLLVGAGVERTSERALDNNDSATSPAYTLVDFLAGYAWGHWRAQVNVYNAFDKVAVGIGVARQIVYPVERRRVQFSLSHTW
jgi:outer membrane receptor protein involved in Fe transport